jgi:hypothetical protein
VAVTYLRFTGAEPGVDSDSGEPRGLFTIAYDLLRSGAFEEHEQAWFEEVVRWFDANLARPLRLARSRRVGAQKDAVSWFKASAGEHVRRMYELVALLQHHGVATQVSRAEHPGYIVYEDDHQIAVVPFRDPS